MACSKVSEGDTLRGVMSLIDEVVTDFRNRGLSRAIAMEQAALALGVSPRRAKALLYGEAFKVTLEEYRAIKRKYVGHLDAEAESLASRFQAIKAKRKQLELDF